MFRLVLSPVNVLVKLNKFDHGSGDESLQLSVRFKIIKRASFFRNEKIFKVKWLFINITFIFLDSQTTIGMN